MQIIMTSIDTVHFRNGSKKTVVTYMYAYHQFINNIFFREITFIVFISKIIQKSTCMMQHIIMPGVQYIYKKASKSIFSIVNSIQCDGYNYFILLRKHVLPLVCGMCPTKARSIVNMFSYLMICSRISTSENVYPKFLNCKKPEQI